MPRCLYERKAIPAFGRCEEIAAGFWVEKDIATCKWKYYKSEIYLTNTVGKSNIAVYFNGYTNKFSRLVPAETEL